MNRIINWIEDLPAEARDMARKNMMQHGYCNPLELVPSLQSALLRAFVWGSGYGDIKYWSDIYHCKQDYTLFS